MGSRYALWKIWHGGIGSGGSVIFCWLISRLGCCGGEEKSEKRFFVFMPKEFFCNESSNHGQKHFYRVLICLSITKMISLIFIGW